MISIHFGFFGFLGFFGFFITLNPRCTYLTINPMGDVILGLIGIALSFFIIKFRRMIGDTIGDAPWMQRVGGIFTITIFAAMGIFLWSLLMIFGLENAFLGPLLSPFQSLGVG